MTGVVEHCSLKRSAVAPKRVLYNPINGRFTLGRNAFSYDVAKAHLSSNVWSSSEYNTQNARNLNFNNGNVNNNNNNKFNSNVVRPVAAFLDCVPKDFIASIWDAYEDCLKGKTTSEGAAEYAEIADEDIPVLAWELWTGNYSPGVSTCFMVRYPKLREVFAANFRDRIVHHWICLRLEPLFEVRFVEQGNVSFNCRKGFGTEAAVNYVAAGMKRLSNNYHEEAWMFRGDLVGFFMSIDQNIMWYHLSRFIKRWRKRYEREGWKRVSPDILDRLHMKAMPEMYWDILLRVVYITVMHRPEKLCVIKSPIHWWRKMEQNKSLFTSPTGMPIGNLTTQLFANFLMSFFVLFIHYLFRGRDHCFAQFVDDFILISKDKDFLLYAIRRIEAFLSTTLHLRLHRHKRYLQSVSHGVLFVGTYIKPGRLYLSNRTCNRFRQKCIIFGDLLSIRFIDPFMLRHILATINSYLGFCRRRRTYHYRLSTITLLSPAFWSYFYIKGHYESAKLRAPKLKPSTASAAPAAPAASAAPAAPAASGFPAGTSGSSSASSTSTASTASTTPAAIGFPAGASTPSAASTPSPSSTPSTASTPSPSSS